MLVPEITSVDQKMAFSWYFEQMIILYSQWSCRAQSRNSENSNENRKIAISEIFIRSIFDIKPLIQ